MIRAVCGQLVRPITSDVTSTLCPNNAASATISGIVGSTRKKSVTRIRVTSHQPA